MSFNEMIQSSPAVKEGRRGIELRRKPDVRVAGLPSVSLLPRELRAAARDRSIRRAFAGAVVVALVIAGGATAGSAALAATAQTRLDAANGRSQVLIGQLAKFKDVQTVQQSIAFGSAAVKVGGSTEIDWQAQLRDITADMPSSYRIVTFAADSASATAEYPQGTSPLDRPRVATVNLSVTASSITGLPIWLRKLRSIPAYADASATVSSDSDQGGYTVALTIHLSPKALVVSKVAK